MGISDKLILNY